MLSRRELLTRCGTGLGMLGLAGLVADSSTFAATPADIGGVGEIDLIDFQQGKVAFSILGRSDFAFHRVAGPEAETPDLAGRYVNIVGSGQVVGLGAAQETEAVLEHL